MTQIASLPTFHKTSQGYLCGPSSASIAPSSQVVKIKPARKPLPEHLPRDWVEYASASICPACRGTRMTRISADKREILEYISSHFKVIVHVRPKLSCRDCEMVTQEPMPSLPIEKGIPGPGLLAHVLIAKYCDHLPLYRQSAFYTRQGVELDRSTLAGWVSAISALLVPLAETIARHVCAGVALHADDAPVPVLERGRGKVRTGYLWVLVRDERLLGSDVPPAACYRYSSDRKSEQVQSSLEEFLDDREQTIRYATSPLNCYNIGGQLEISNNAVERVIHPLLLGRKNWTFAGSHASGRHAATLYTLIETARMNGIDPEAYLRDIINRIPAHSINRIEELLPWNYYKARTC